MANIVAIGFGGTFDSPYASPGARTGDLDTNYIFYYLGTNFGTAGWSNPTADVTWSQTGITGIPTSFANSTDNMTIRADNSSYVRQSGAGYAELIMDFGGGGNNIIVRPAQFNIQGSNGNSSPIYFMQNMTLEGSNDNVTYTVLASRPAQVPSTEWGPGVFDKGWGTGMIANLVFNNDPGFYRYLKWRWNTVSGGSSSVRVHQMQIWGEMKRTDGGTASQQSPVFEFQNLLDVEDSPADGEYLLWWDNQAIWRREAPYFCSRQALNANLQIPDFGSTSDLVTFYILTPDVASREVALPTTPSQGMHYRIKNLDLSKEILVKEGVTTVSTISTAAGISQCDCYYTGTTWRVIEY